MCENDCDFNDMTQYEYDSYNYSVYRKREANLYDT